MLPPSFSLHSRAGRVRLALPLLFAVVAAACGDGGGDSTRVGVGVRKVSADISFGLKVSEAKAGAEVTAPTDVSDIEADQEVALPELPSSFGRKRQSPLVRPAVPCRVATVNDNPARAAGNFSDSLPEAGSYRWKRGGEQELKALPGQIIKLEGFERRTLRNIVVESENMNPTNNVKNLVYSYEMVIPNSSINGLSILEFQVKTNAEAQREVNVQVGGRARAGEAERGLVLKKKTDIRGDGNRTEYDYTAAGLLLLPLPVSPGEEFTSTAVNSRNVQQRTSYTATVGTKVQIDACGDLVEGWEVKGELREPDGFTTQYNIVVATQYGVVLIQEAYDFELADYGKFRPVLTLGQVSPTKVEAQ
jgi:hypothetical protein